MKFRTMLLVIAALLISTVPARAEAAGLSETWSATVKINDDPGIAEQTDPDVEVDANGYLYAVWEDERNGGRDIYFSRSIDGGATWSANTMVNDLGSGACYDPDVDVDANGHIYVVWQQLTGKDIYCARSTDGGVSWGAPVMVNGSADKNQWDPCLVADRRPGTAGNLVVAWADNRNYGSCTSPVCHYDDIYAACSFDGGQSWGTNTLVTRGDTPQDKRASYPEMAISGSRVSLIYRNASGDIEIYKAGASLPALPSSPFDWSGSSSISGKWGANETGIDIAFDGNDSSYIGFSGFSTDPYPPNEPPGTNTNIYGAIVRASGDTEDVDDQPDDTDNSYRNVTVAARGTGYAYAAWADRRSGKSYRYIYFTESSNKGVTWSSNTQISQDNHVGENPSMVAAPNGTLYLAWQDNRYGNANVDILFRRGEPFSASPRPWVYDYNGDGTSDIAIYRSAAGLWAIRGVTRVYFGGATDETVPGDYDGDGTTDIGVFRISSGLWAIKGVTRAYFGGGSDLPQPGDYNGDGTADIGLFRPGSGLWAIKGVTRVYFGGSTDEPIPGYYNADASKDIGLFRPASGLWAIKGVTRIYFGGSTDEPIPGDYNGDGVWDAGIFRPSSGLWAIIGVTRAYFGGSTDDPFPADYSGDGTDDIGIFRVGSGLWAAKGVTRVYFGGSSDIPVVR